MNDDELVPIYETTEAGLAEVIRVALDGEGIDCTVEHGGYTGLLPCRLFVKAEDEAQAREFIAEHERTRGESEES